jgi:hypothetical protein
MPREIETHGLWCSSFTLIYDVDNYCVMYTSRTIVP